MQHSTSFDATPSAAGSRLHKPSRRHWLAALAGGLVALPAAACAHRWLPPAAGVAGLDVIDRDSGRVTPVHHKGGLMFVAGRPGARYALRVRNLAPRRVLLVVSVDGINVISGDTAAWHQVGYVLEPGQVHDITGWRKSDREVAAFEYAALEDSYAARTGRPGAVGVIGMAAFVERAPAPPPPAPAVSERRAAEPLSAPPAPLASARPAPGAPPALTAAPRAESDSAGHGGRVAESAAGNSAQASSKLGTGHGARESSWVRHTRFERASATPDQVLRIEYDSSERLVAAGVIAPPPRPSDVWPPSPFPANPVRYTPDPPPRW